MYKERLNWVFFFLIASLIYGVQYFTDDLYPFGVLSSLINGMNPLLELIVSIILLAFVCMLFKLVYKIRRPLLVFYVLAGIIGVLVLYVPLSFFEESNSVHYLEFAAEKEDINFSGSWKLFNSLSFGLFILFFILNIPKIKTAP